MPAIMVFLTFFNEIFPLIHAAVQVAQAQFPASAPGAAKFDAVLKGVSDVVQAAPAASTDFTNARAALATGDATSFTVSAGHMIELSLSILKSAGAFPKAGIVQNAAPLAGAATGNGGD